MKERFVFDGDFLNYSKGNNYEVISEIITQ
jgi:hypothetical protein